MASKEATVYIVDCGASMGERSHGRQQTNLDWALEYVWDKLTATIATGRKTAMAGVVGLRTGGTKNLLDDEADYAHISTFQEIGQLLMPHVRRLRNELVVSSTNTGDAISALVIAIQMIAVECKKLKYERKIVLVTDARGSMQTDDLESIVTKLKEDNIKLDILGVDFDDPEYGFKEESKDSAKAENEEILKQLCDDCDGQFATLADAVDHVGMPNVKTVRPTPLYKGLLTLGDSEEYETAFSINVERYPKTMAASAPSASQFVVRSDHGDAETNGTGDGLAAVKNARTYQVDDENAPGGKKELDRDELARGYEYGRTAVHISESDRNVTTYETEAGFAIIGFVAKEQYERYLDMNRAAMTVAQRSNDQASIGLSSLIHALEELRSYAVVRLVPKENKDPRIVLMAPHIDIDMEDAADGKTPRVFECLYDVELPFTEDLRSYRFPPLDRVVTVSGKEIRVHRNLPNNELQQAMSDYVDSMDLSTFGNDDGKPTEYMPMNETYMPMLHRINQVIKHRAVFPDAEPPPPYEILTRYAHPPEDLLQKAEPALKRAIEAADVKKVPPKARGRRHRHGRKDAPKPLSELDIGALLAQDPKRKLKRIDPKNAIPEFRQLVDQGEKQEVVRDACGQLAKIIFDRIRHSVGSSGYEQAIEAIRVMREETAELEMAEPYNKFLRDLKAKLKSDELGTGRFGDVLYRVRGKRLGMLQESECPGGVSEEEAKSFLSPKA